MMWAALRWESRYRDVGSWMLRQNVQTQYAHRHSSTFWIELLKPRNLEEELKKCNEVVMVIKGEDFRRYNLN